MNPLSIDELADVAGLPRDQVRLYRDRGLLPGIAPPADRYGREHLERLRLLNKLEGDGLSLEFIEQLVNDRQHGAERLAELRTHLLSGLYEHGQTVKVEELVGRFGDFGGRVLDQAIQCRLLVPRPDGLIDVPSPPLLDIAERAVSAGLSLMTSVRMAGVVREACLSASGAFLSVIIEEVWRPFEQAGFPEDEFLDIASRLYHLRPLAQSVFEATLPGVMVEVFDRAFDEDLGIIPVSPRTADDTAEPE